MKALRFYGFGDMRIDDVPYPDLRPGWVIIKVSVSQMSVTEAALAFGFKTLAYDMIKRAMEQEAPLQLFGHEFCGTIAETGEGVENFAAGDRVAARSEIPCGECHLCRTGKSHRCKRGPLVGFQIPGSLAEYVALPVTALAKLPEQLSDHEGACIQPLSSAVSCVESADIRMGESVVVLGQGVMGLYCAQVARVSGAGLVVGVDIRDESLEAARELGADVVIDGRSEDSRERVMRLTDGVGPDVVFECAGGDTNLGLSGTETLRQAMDMVRDGGRIVQVAIIGDAYQMDIVALRRREVKYIFPDLTTEEMLRHAVHLVASRRVQVAPLINHVLEGFDSIPEAFRITANKKQHRALNPAQVVLST